MSSMCLDKRVEAQLRSLPGNNVRTMSFLFDRLIVSLRSVAIAMARVHNGPPSPLVYLCAWSVVVGIEL
jgi:hypothetical protein